MSMLADSLDKASGGCEDPMVLEMIALHNKERASEGLAALKIDASLCEMALAHSKDQAKCALPPPQPRLPLANATLLLRGSAAWLHCGVWCKRRPCETS